MNEIDALIKMSEESDDGEVGKGRMNMLRNLVMQLRKCCLHPYLFDFAEPDISRTGAEELIASSGKLAVLDKLLLSLFKNGHRTCIFSQFTSMLNILEDYCVLRGWKYCRFDGSTPRAQRNHLINQFNAPGSDDFIFLMSTRSGGLGINLQTADTCILYDSDWNPQPDLQAMARVHRIGQKSTVHIYRLVSSGTVEERILERAEKKLYLDQMVNRGGSNQDMNQDGSGLSSSELLASLKFGSNAIFASSNDLPTDSDIRKIIDRNRSETTSDGLLKGGVTNSANDFDKDKELTDVRTFEGVDFRKLRDANKSSDKKNKRGAYLNELKQEWKEALDVNGTDMGKGKRNKKSRIVNVNGIGSGYGSASIPILALNDYDLQQGELSVWNETKKPVVRQPPKQKVRPKQFINQDFCQTCGQGGELILCPRCPVSVHSHCCGLRPDHFQSCSHHRCSICDKTANGAGGLIYPCQSCPSAFCGDCLPSKDIRFLGTNIPRFEKLGRKSNNLYHYIHCSKQCEHVATVEFGFKDIKAKPKCPSPIDVSYAFGKNASSIKEISKLYKDEDSSPDSKASSQLSSTSNQRRSPRKSMKPIIKSEEIIVVE
jgi:SWI/SNF-related matrix-associated actin-dependent regulator of chromatin subfamily A member 5